MITPWAFLTNYVARKTKLLERSRNKQNISLIILKMQNLLHLAERSKGMTLKENQSTSKSKLSFFIMGCCYYCFCSNCWCRWRKLILSKQVQHKISCSYKGSIIQVLSIFDHPLLNRNYCKIVSHCLIFARIVLTLSASISRVL